MKYVTLIAQPDFNGVPKVLFKSVTDDDHLDVTPRMRLVDAVDAKANNRGDLVFELRSHRDREFVIYRIAGGQAEQVFTTGSLPNSNSPRLISGSGQLGRIPPAAQSLDELHAGGKLAGGDVRRGSLVG